MFGYSEKDEKLVGVLADLFSSGEAITAESLEQALQSAGLGNAAGPIVRKVYAEQIMNEETGRIEDDTSGPYAYTINSVNLALAAIYAIQQQNLLLSQIQTSLATLTSWRSGIITKLKKLFPLVSWDGE